MINIEEIQIVTLQLYDIMLQSCALHFRSTQLNVRLNARMQVIIIIVVYFVLGKYISLCVFKYKRTNIENAQRSSVTK